MQQACGGVIFTPCFSLQNISVKELNANKKTLAWIRPHSGKLTGMHQSRYIIGFRGLTSGVKLNGG